MRNRKQYNTMIKRAKKVKQNWASYTVKTTKRGRQYRVYNITNHSLAENIAQANARIEEFARAGKSSQAMEATQQWLSIHGHKSTTINGEEVYQFKPQSKWTAKEKEQAYQQLKNFLGSETGTLEKSQATLKRQWESFTDRYQINRRVLTFNKYTELFENYSEFFDFDYADSDRVVRAVMEHVFQEGWEATVRGVNGQQAWLDKLLEDMKDVDKNEQTQEEIDSWYFEAINDRTSKGWVLGPEGFPWQDRFL